MAGKKRARKAAATKGKGRLKNDESEEDAPEEVAAPAAAAATTPTKSESVLPNSPLFVLLQELHRLALDPEICQKSLQSLAEGTSPVLNLGSPTASVALKLPSPYTTAAAQAAAAAATSTTDSVASTNSSKKKKRARVSASAAAAASKSQQQQQQVPEAETTQADAVAHGGFWILLATHVLNRLLASMDQYEDVENTTAVAASTTGKATKGNKNSKATKNAKADNNAKKIKTSQLISLLSYFLARVLLPIHAAPSDGSSNSNNTSANSNANKSNHDRIMHKLLEKACSNRARSLLGRAVLSITVAATGALEHLVESTESYLCENASDGDDDMEALASLSLACYIPATLALDIVVRLSHASPKAYVPATTTAATSSASSPLSPMSSLANNKAARTTSPTASSSTPTAALSTTTEPAGLMFWNQSQSQMEDKAMNLMKEFSTDWDAICQEISHSLDMTQWEEPCLAALTGIAIPPRTTTTAAGSTSPAHSTPPAKRSKMRRKSSRGTGAADAASAAASTLQQPEVGTPTADPGLPAANHPLLQAFQALLSDSPPDSSNNKPSNPYKATKSTAAAAAAKAPLAHLNGMKMDGRVAAKRWSSMALVWLLQGHRRILEAVVGMMTHRNDWHAVVWQDGEDDNNTRKKGSGSKSSASISTAAVATVLIPGNVAFMALASRLAGLVTETQLHSGTRAPSGGLDAYVRAILPACQAQSVSLNLTKKSTTVSGKKVTKKSPKTVLPDLRNLATVVLYHLLQAHEDCLEVNFQNLENENGEEVVVYLVNDDDHYSEDLDRNSNSPTDLYTLRYHPAMKHILEGLCRAAAATTGSTVSASGVGSSAAASSFSEQALGMERLYKIASAFVLQNISDDAVAVAVTDDLDSTNDSTPRGQRPLDVQLVHCALKQLAECLEKAEICCSHYAETQTGAAISGWEFDEEVLKRRYHLADQLPIPRFSIGSEVAMAASTSARRGKGSASKSADANASASPCFFAGVLALPEDDPTKAPQEDDVLSLFLRSMAGGANSDENKNVAPRAKSKRKQSKRSKESTDTVSRAMPTSRLYSKLLDVVQSCYTGLSERKAELVSLEASKETDARKKRRTSPAKEPARKRRKADEGTAVPVKEADDSDSVVEARTLRHPLTAHRAALAEEANNVLWRCIQKFSSKTTQPSPFGMLLNSMRDAMTEEHIVRVIELTKVLDDHIVMPRTAKFLDEKSCGQASSVPNIEPTQRFPDAPAFASFEKNLWLSHFHLCGTIGKGDAIDNGEENTFSRFLRDASKRLAVFQAIAKAYHPSEKCWPLWLPPTLRAMVSFEFTNQSNLSAEEQAGDTSPELFIVDGVINSISNCFDNLGALPKPSRSASEDRVVVDYEIPLSLQDARLFLVAVSRLKPLERSKCLAKLLACVLSSIKSITEDESSRETMCKNSEASSLLARVVTVCSHMMIFTRFPELFGRICNVFRHSQTSEPPSFASECDWYRSERCYMGVLSDWESARVPSLSEVEHTSDVSKAVVNDMASILETSFALGFGAAKSDRGHLLFAAWNGMGNMPLWDPHRNSDRSKNRTLDNLLTSLRSKEGTDELELPRILLELREEVCRLYMDMNTNLNDGQPVILPLALKFAQSKEKTAQSSPQIKKNLKSVVATGEKLLLALLDCDESMPSLFSSLEAAAIYMSFGVASHTKPSNDAFSENRVVEQGKRIRGYSSDNEREHTSDLDSVESDSDEDDPDSKLRERLRNACTEFGAAPTHPDWLDEKCLLQFGVASSEALEVGRTAVRGLTKLLATSFARHKRSLQRAIDLLGKAKKGKVDKNQSLLARKILVLLTRYDSTGFDPSTSLYDPNEDYDVLKKEFLASLGECASSSLEFYTSCRASENLEEAKTAWCLNSAQRIPGRFQEANKGTHSAWLCGAVDSSCSLPELRTDRQWEVLLGSTLASSCRDSANAAPESADEEEIREALINAENWLGVCEVAVSTLMPAAALLRFGMARGGRKAHALASVEEEEITKIGDCFEHFRVVERLTVSITASKQLRDMLSETLSLLARFSAQSAGDSPSSTSCHAVASNLLVDGRSFEDLRGFESSRFALTMISELHESSGKMSDDDMVDFSEPSRSRLLIKRATAVVEFWGRDLDPPNNATSFGRLMNLLRNTRALKIDTVAENGVEIGSMLALLDNKGHDKDTFSPHESTWRWGGSHEQPIVAMASLVCNENALADVRSRGCMSMILRCLSFAEYDIIKEDAASKFFIISTLVTVFNAISDETLKTFLSEITKPSDESSDDTFRTEACLLLGYLVLAQSREQPIFTRVNHVVKILTSCAPQWLTAKSGTDSILDLLLLFGCCDNNLTAVGEALLKEVSSDGGNLESIAKFFRFLQGLRAALVDKKGDLECPPDTTLPGNAPAKGSLVRGAAVQSDAQPQTSRGKTASEDLPLACSYALKSGFHGQHWYNCYTCGLTWDKGCCTLCALVCHQGHDVSYSRYSSFFCDCGAEDGGESDRTRVSCKCLSTLSAEKVRALYRDEGWGVEQEENKVTQTEGSKGKPPKGENDESETLYIQIAKASFPKQAQVSLDKLIKEAGDKGWLESLFQILRRKFDAWSQSTSDSSSLEEVLLDEYDPIEYDVLRQSLPRRIGKPLNLEPLKEGGLTPIRAAKANSFQVKFAGTTSERLKRSKNELNRAAIVADNRGRLVIAEPCSLLFLSAASCVNVRHLKETTDLPLTRSSVCILGSTTVRCNVVGMELCPGNDRHLLVWGTSEAFVALLKDSHDGVDRQIALSLDLDPSECETDYVVKCTWIPGSQTCVAVGCGRFVSIFDIARADKDNRAVPVISFALALDSSLRDIAAVPNHSLRQTLSLNTTSASVLAPETAASLYLMLENGRLHCVDLENDRDGKLSARAGAQFEASEAINLPLAGARSFQSAAVVEAQDSHSLTLGDGSCLAYLAQSNLLLYKCSNSCVLALTIGITGKITGSFELLPHVISPEMLGASPMTAYSIGGPYTNWTELGQARYTDGSQYFRVACVGRSWRTTQPKMLVIEFNDAAVKVKEVTWSDSLGCGLSLYSSFEGACAFSLPFRSDVGAVPSAFAEKAFLCAVTSNGCMLLYGEESGLSLSEPKEDPISSNADEPADSAKLNANKPNVKTEVAKPFISDRAILSNYPITIFERLQNLSEDSIDEVIYGGDGLGSDSKEIRRKLTRDNSVFLASPRREGFTMTVALKGGTETGHAGLPKATMSSSLVFAAVRFLVGSASTECIPKKVFVQGRPVEITAGTKKWYSISFTDEEIALTMRTGVLAITVSQAFDSSSNSILDAFEVYAVDKPEIDSWLPKKLQDSTKSAPSGRDETLVDSAGPRSIILTSRSLESLCDILGTSKSLPKTESDLLKRMVQHTAVNRNVVVRDCVDKLLCRLYPSPQARNSIRDEGALQGCSLLLSKCQVLLETTRATEEARPDSSSFENGWFTVRALLRSCLRAAAHIARRRPINYLRASDVIAENKISSGSIAVDSSKLIREGIRRELPCEDLCELFVEVALAESAIADNTSMNQGENLASFIIVRKLLESNNLAVVERSCHAISCFCRLYGSSDQSRGESTNDLFAALHTARVVCYQCDNCEKVPITDVRFTLLEDDHDIDLCKQCFELGFAFSETKNFDQSTKVVIKGKELDLTCALIKAMQPVPIVKADVTEVADVQADRDSQMEDAGDENDELQRALRLSLGSANDDGTIQASQKLDQSLEDFVDSIFSSVVDLLSNALVGHPGEPRLGLMLALLTDLVHHSSEKAGLSRAKKLAAEISIGTSRLIVAASNSSTDFQRTGRLTLIMCLRALAYLLIPEVEGHVKKIDSSGATAKPDIKQIACDVHRVPAVRRKCARGEHKDRRFYVCGMERHLRCKFFQWADSTGQNASAKPRRIKSKNDKELATALWRLFSSSANAGTTEMLHLQLCSLLEGILDGWRSSSSSRLALAATDGNEEFQKLTLHDNKKAMVAFSDGVFCSREKLQDFSADKVLQSTDAASQPSIASIAGSFYADGDIELIEAALKLLALIANHETDGIDRWFGILCEIIGSSSSKSASVRTLAKRVLKQLCGGKKSLYHSVRDHYVLGFQLKMLLKNTQGLLKNALLMKEKARQSGPNWSSDSLIGWAELKAGDLIGAEMLISEDCYSQCDVTTCDILDDLCNIAKNRTENWRRFCGLVALPQSYKGNAALSEDSLLGEFQSPAPIIALLWISCVVSGPNQLKALRLVDLALLDSKKSNTKLAKDTSTDDEGASDGDAKGSLSWLKTERKSPEDILLRGQRKCSVGDVYAFVMQFAYHGRTAELRRISTSIVSKLMKTMNPADTGVLVGQLLGDPLCDAGFLGKNGVEMLNTLQAQLRYSSMFAMEVKEYAAVVLHYFKQQYQAIKHDRANGEWVCLESNSGMSRRRFDLSNCVHCHWINTTSASKESTSSSKTTDVASATRGRASSSSVRSSNVVPAAGNTASTQTLAPHSAAKREWIPSQVSPFTRGRLDSSKETTTNDSFSSYRQLKYRLALSEIHVTVNDPRGRFVKTITVYFTPRPVSDVQVLKTDAYSRKWQRCASLNLSRGASRASVVLPIPVIAANLKLEYTEFYERPGGSKAADGTLLVHCPRCTRVVNNAHGVCGNCGEVAFQCRKCRHINYDQLQSFLCVECGFCSAGSFAFDLVAGVASNAVAITSDDEKDRADVMLRTATRLHEDLREGLRERLRTAVHLKKTTSKDQQHESAGPRSFLSSPGLRRAFQGHEQDPPSISTNILLERAGKKGWAVKMIAMPSHLTSSIPIAASTAAAAAADRTRSLLRLARQLRTEGGSQGRRRSGDIVIRQLGRGGAAVEAIEEESDLLNLLENPGGALGSLAGGLSGAAGAGGLLGAADPLSRLLASFQTTRSGAATGAGAAAAAAGTSAAHRTRAATSSGVNPAERQALSSSTTSRGRAASNANASTASHNSTTSTSNTLNRKLKEAIDDCEKLHALLREAEREAYDLHSRVEAWKRLERDELADKGRCLSLSATAAPPNKAFSPSHCSVCSGPVAVQLLVLWLRLFQLDPNGVDVNQECIELLMEENVYLSKNLMDLKRAVVREIAIKAPAETSRLVLNELAKRLRAIRDVASAEILGNIIGQPTNKGSVDFPLAQEYVNLAMEALEHEATIF